MWIGVVSLFPQMFRAVREHGMPSRAIAGGQLALEVANPREYAADRHGTVDDAPYGGGPGMVMMAEPIALAIEALSDQSPMPAHRIYLTPEGRRFDQELAEELLGHASLLLIAGHYEGVDERLRHQLCDDEISIGDYVLSGGELPAMVLIDALARRLPGVLGNADSLQFESFDHDRLEGAQYTRPRVWRGESVPGTLLSGDHQAVASWRKRSSFERTYRRRPDLFRRRRIESDEITFIEDICKREKHA